MNPLSQQNNRLLADCYHAASGTDDIQLCSIQLVLVRLQDKELGGRQD